MNKTIALPQGPNPAKVYKRAILLFKARRSHCDGRVVWEYLATTNASRTCREAKARACEVFGLEPAQVRALFKKG